MDKRKKSSAIKRKEGKEASREGDRTVEFVLRAPKAKEVYLTGEFNCWNTESLPMKRNKDGIWKAQIELPPGRYEYKYFSDGAWVEDIPGVKAVSNPFGTQNLVIWVE